MLRLLSLFNKIENSRFHLTYLLKMPAFSVHCKVMMCIMVELKKKKVNVTTFPEICWFRSI